MMSFLYAFFEQLDERLKEKHAKTLSEIYALKYVYDSDDQKTFLSGKLEAYEEIILLIREIL